MINTNHSHIGRLKENDLNPSEKIMELVRVENFRKLMEIVSKSPNAGAALNDSFIPLSKFKL